MDVGRLKPSDDFIYPSDCALVAADQIQKYLVCPQMDQKIDETNSYCEMITADLLSLEETVRYMQMEIDKLAHQNSQLASRL